MSEYIDTQPQSKNNKILYRGETRSDIPKTQVYPINGRNQDKGRILK